MKAQVRGHQGGDKLVGGQGQAVVALDRHTGKELWKRAMTPMLAAGMEPAEVAELVRKQCADLSYQRGEGMVQVSVSIGAAELPEGTSFESVRNAASYAVGFTMGSGSVPRSFIFPRASSVSGDAAATTWTPI